MSWNILGCSTSVTIWEAFRNRLGTTGQPVNSWEQRQLGQEAVASQPKTLVRKNPEVLISFQLPATELTSFISNGLLPARIVWPQFSEDATRIFQSTAKGDDFIPRPPSLSLPDRDLWAEGGQYRFRRNITLNWRAEKICLRSFSQLYWSENSAIGRAVHCLQEWLLVHSLCQWKILFFPGQKSNIFFLQATRAAALLLKV